MRKKVSKTNLAVVLIAEEPANNNATIVAVEDTPDLEKIAPCSMQLVQNVAKILWYHSSQLATDLYIAETVSKAKELAVINNKVNKDVKRLLQTKQPFFDFKELNTDIHRLLGFPQIIIFNNILRTLF